MLTGLQVLMRDNFAPLEGCRIGLVVNHISVADDLLPSYIHFLKNPALQLGRIFAPEHGLWGVAQDQEKVSTSIDSHTGQQIVSLYGSRLAPTAEMIADLDVLVFDVQDIGARYYTFIYTVLLMMKECARFGKKCLILDRPNPLGGLKREGNILDKQYSSFVGLYPLPVVHGLTVGEIASYINTSFNLGCELQVIACEGWQRAMYYDETGLVWIPPSPNMPTLQTALVYPGCCLFEGTNISEGRGTTLPFEMVGAPWIDPWAWVSELNKLNLSGVTFRPLFFKPLTNKYAGQICGGVQIHVSDRTQFPAYFNGIAMIKTAHDLYPEQFAWKSPPYEFETERLPIDILTGTNLIRRNIEDGDHISLVSAGWDQGIAEFEARVAHYLLY
ncbi:exo-beta-N-acetylmuramidase NamZ domain-containing protein [candidate division CSSED10-310 bacterium]|uniref:Exo-beta-N-acetylmuramidase NamZ domain-containing protein n=1 Tax=candidate division CSSED10-310 bacterium TaxID=2855610 RepID=A0ABV6Z4K4_UNCC1